ncbi:hypothetical protein PT7_2227 [Pusillimonas sp. T7-7]|uniref:2-hydroxychromene-2-carboxylate isomerase n=1 Tax=Pusillimonas sp. (strain T7-7) TaxID=1007105 RepID=UPI0002085435|nr:DsbA family protein [Pusillimonas sp. T7-7]AEC20767.1 hypothetical protein PT7_2227 [Pusillimonas sp. T7-7]
MSNYIVQAYWSFRSPYSYLSVARMLSMEREYALEWDLRIVYPLAIRRPGHFTLLRKNPLARPYFMIDSARVAEQLGLPFRRPTPDPIVQDPITLEVAEEQPYIRHLTHLGIEAVRRGCGLAFIDEISRLLWSGAVNDWHQDGHLEAAAKRAGLDLADMERTIAVDSALHEAIIESNHEALRSAGHWGVPTFAFEGEAFFGQDRLDTLLWSLRQHGMPTRNTLKS